MFKTCITTASNFCKECGGKCWDSSSNSKTQENARKIFGQTPNNCIPDENGRIRCPHHSK